MAQVLEDIFLQLNLDAIRILVLSPAKSLSDKFKTGSAAMKHHPFLHQAQSKQGLLPSWEHLKVVAKEDTEGWLPTLRY